MKGVYNSAFKKVFSNGFYLGLNYALNFLIPIIITPYVVRVVGLEKFGLISIALYIVQYLNVAVDYGFNLVGTKDVSLNRSCISELSQIVCSALVVKLVLLIISIILVLIGSGILFFLDKEVTIFLLSMTLVVGQSLSVNFFFQGIEKLREMSIVNVIFKSLSVLLILVFVRNEADYVFVNFYLGLGTSLASLVLLIFVFTKHGISFTKVSYSEVIDTFIKGKDIFLSNLYISIYNYSNALILGLFAPVEIVGIYSILEKVINIVRQVIGVFIQAIYPNTCILASQSYSKLLGFLRPVWLLFSLLIIISTFLIFCFSDEISFYILGYKDIDTAFFLKVMSFIPLFVVSSSYYTIVVLSNGFNSDYRRTFFLAALISILFNFILASILVLKGTILSVYLTELFIVIMLVLTVQKIKKNNLSLSS